MSYSRWRASLLRVLRSRALFGITEATKQADYGRVFVRPFGKQVAQGFECSGEVVGQQFL